MDSVDSGSKKGKLSELLHTPWIYISSTVRWMLLAAVVGIAGGFIGGVFAKGVELVSELRSDNGWIIYLMPIGGIIIVALTRALKVDEGYGTNQVINAARSSESVPIGLLPMVFVNSLLTHLVGGSAGKEGAALQMGGSIGYAIGSLFKLDETDKRMMVTCGMSALFASVFRAPLTAAIFAVEVLSVGEMYYGSLIPSLSASLVSFGIANKVLGLAPFGFVLNAVPEFGIVSALQVIAVAAVCSAMSILFCVCITRGHKFADKLIENPYLRIIIGSLLLVGFTLLLGTREYNGDGIETITAAINGNAKPEAFILKLVFTTITMSVGFKGGEIVPSFFIGATLGCIIASIVGLDAGFGAAIGMVSMFCGAVNCPVASILLSIEAFGAQGILLFGLACALSYTLSGYYGLYGSQKIIYSKLKSEFINRFTH